MCTRSSNFNLKNAKAPWCGRGDPPLPPLASRPRLRFLSNIVDNLAPPGKNSCVRPCACCMLRISTELLRESTVQKLRATAWIDCTHHAQLRPRVNAVFLVFYRTFTDHLAAASDADLPQSPTSSRIDDWICSRFVQITPVNFSMPVVCIHVHLTFDSDWLIYFWAQIDDLSLIFCQCMNPLFKWGSLTFALDTFYRAYHTSPCTTAVFRVINSTTCPSFLTVSLYVCTVIFISIDFWLWRNNKLPEINTLSLALFILVPCAFCGIIT